VRKPEAFVRIDLPTPRQTFGLACPARRWEYNSKDTMLMAPDDEKPVVHEALMEFESARLETFKTVLRHGPAFRGRVVSVCPIAWLVQVLR
jgi:hypothetical protein